MSSMTFGKLPGITQFQARFRVAVGQSYQIALQGAAADAWDMAGVKADAVGTLNSRELYAALQALADFAECGPARAEEARGEAWQLAADIMTTLGYEWV